MSRYMLFTGESYYPMGGMGDFAWMADDLEVLHKRVAYATKVKHKEIPETRRKRGVEFSTSPTFIRRDPEEIITIPAVPAWTEYRRSFDWAHIYDTTTGMTSHASFNNRTKKPTWTKFRP